MSGTITHSWNGTVLTITSDSGTSSADLKGDTGIRGAQGAPGIQGEPGTIDTSKVYTKENPPTAEEVGARNKEWLPTPAEIGAKEADWMPTAEEIGAKDIHWMPTAEEVGARSVEWIPTAEEIGARSIDWLPTAKEIGAVEAIEDLTYKNCYYRIVDGVIEWINPPNIYNTEYRTTERFNGYPIYIITIPCGNGPYSTVKAVAHNTNIAQVLKTFGTCSSSSNAGGIYDINSYLSIWADKTNVYLSSPADQRGTYIDVQIYYIKA